ncbi:MAG: DUF3341 domain-containing protein [Alphaproteobacteria bacterium]
MSCYGLLGEFPDPETLTSAARRMRESGYRRMDAFSPFPIDGLAAALGMRKTRLPWVVLAGGVIGAAATYGLVWYSLAIDYPINVGGRPLHAWTPFVVLAFEGGILGAGLSAFFGMLAANGQPEYYHPVFNAKKFSYARGGGFFLLVEAADPRFDRAEVARNLAAVEAISIEEIAR